MRRKNWKIWLGMAMVTLTVIGLVVIPAAMANGSQDEEGTTTPTPPDPTTVGENFAGKVAANLGVSVDTLKNAITDAALQMVDEALANGTITQEQAEQIRERIREGAAGGCLRWFGWRCGGPIGAPGHWGGVRLMGCIEEAIESGVITQEQADQIKTLAQQIRNQIRQRIENRFLAEAVEEGILTQEQADQINALCDQIRDQLQEQARENWGKGGMGGRGWGKFGGGNGQ